MHKINWRTLFKKFVLFFEEIHNYLKFFILLFIFILQKITKKVRQIPVIGKLLGVFFDFFDKSLGFMVEKLIFQLNLCHHDVKTRRIFLINLAYKNLLMKKTRTLVTILGMSVGIGVIVFLISLGYGIERLIINQVATLEETRIIDVSAGENTSVRLDRDVYRKIKQLKNVKDIVPIVSLVGKVTYNKASTDVIVYSTPRKYFDLSRFKLLKGKYFNDNTIFEEKNISQKSDIKGVYSQLKTKVNYLTPVDDSYILFNVLPDKKVGVWENCDVKSQFLGYALRLEGGYLGKEFYGSSFYPFSENGLVGINDENIKIGLWIKSKFPLFQVSILEGNEVLTPILDKDGKQIWQDGCVPKYTSKLKIEEKFNLGGEVLGLATESAEIHFSTLSANLVSREKKSTESAVFLKDLELVSSSEGGIEIVTLKSSESAKDKDKVIDFKEPTSGMAVVSLGLLNLLNIPLNNALKTNLDLSLVVVKSLMPEIEGKVMTVPARYEIIGVIDDTSSAYLYLPFSDLNKLAIKNLSQLKVIAYDKKNISSLRKEIETMGFKTSSVVDTIKQIESLFTNVRLVLALVGLVALVVAALGMFNTLTVSLLERTREIGGMKVMGVVSHEIEDLFIAEAMIMGLSGGFGGLILGFLAGKFLSIIISLLAFSTQREILDLTYIPLPFVFFIIGLSFFVGIITGIYPAQRAKKISALNALRYE